MTTINTPEGIDFAQLCALKGALSLECKGMTRRGRSAYAIAKERYGLRGSKAKVLEQLQRMVDQELEQ